MNADRLLANFDTLVDTPGAVPRLRRFILDLAVRGKLVPQDPTDEPASELLSRIAAETPRYRVTMMQPSHSLPNAWQWVAVGNLFAYDVGIKSEPSAIDPDVWVLDLQDIEKDTGRLLARVTAAQRISTSTKSEFLAGDILYGKLRPYLNKVLVANEHGYSTTEIVALRSYIPLCAGYCALALRRPDFVNYVTRVGQGTKMPRLRRKDAVVAPFPLPPLAEQHRIVAKVDELMTLCDRLKDARQEREAARDRFTTTSLARLGSPDPDKPTFHADAAFAIENFDRITARSDQVTALRRTILDLAVRGKLVPQSSAEGDGESLLNEKENTRSQCTHARLMHRKGKLHGKAEYQGPPELDVPSNWTVVRLGQAVDLINGRAFKPSDWTQSGLPIVRIQNLNNPAAKFNRYDGDVRSKFLIDSGDFLISWSGTPGTSFGAHIWQGGPAILNQHIFKAVLIAEVFEPKFLKLAINSRMTDLIEQAHGGVGLQHITKPKLQAISLALPPLAEQRRIVARLDELMIVCDRLAARLATSEDTRCSMLDAVLHEVLERDARTAAAPVTLNAARSG